MIRHLLLLVFFFTTVLGIAQHQEKVDFIRGEVFVRPNPQEKNLYGRVVYEFKVLKDVDSVFLDAKNISIKDISLDGNTIKFSGSENTITVYNTFKEGITHELEISFYAQPKQAIYFIGWDDSIEGNEQIWTQGQGKYTSHWLPSFDDMEEKVEFDLTIATKSDLNVIANGEYVYTSTTRDSNIDEWHFDMLEPMSSYLLAFAIGKYNKQELTSKSGIPIENYYYPKDSLKVEPTYRYTKEIFDFLEEEIGVAYPWQNYKQIPVRDFLYAGMENTTTTIFSDGYVIDSTAFVDKNYVNVNAHELAHQWFGNLVTEKDGNHHWLHEGFATYYAQLAEKELFGDDHYYWKLYSSLLELQGVIEKEEGQALTDPKASSLTFYEKGAWALYMLRNEVGDAAFRKGIQNYLKTYKFKNATISDFLKEIETASKEDLSRFKKDWLDTIGIPLDAAKNQLRKDNESIAELFSMQEEFQIAQSHAIDYAAYWEKTNSIHLKKHMMDTYPPLRTENLWNRAFASDTIPIRQVISRKMDSIPPALKTKFESLLHDKSYVTIENVLFKLWVTFPEEKAKYLEQTKDVIGLPNKNVRLLWLTLAILTNDYKGRNTQEYFKELSSYTSKAYSWEIRMGAFQYLNQAVGLNNESLKSLVSACTHHSWQFKKFARNLVSELLKDSEYKERLIAITEELKGEELRYMNTKLQE